MGIRTKLLVCLLIVLVPITAASMFSIHVVDSHLTARIEAGLENSRRLEATHISELLEGYRRDAANLASSPHLQDFMSRLEAHRRGTLPPEVSIGGVDTFALVDRDADWPLQQLALALQRNSAATGAQTVDVRLIDLAGETLGESIGFEWQPRDSALVETALTSGVLSFGDAFINSQAQRRLGIVAPVYSNGGRIVGGLMMEMRLEPLVHQVTQYEGIGQSSEAHIAQRLPNGDAEMITQLRFDREAAFELVIPERERDMPIMRSLNARAGEILYARDYRGVESILAVEAIPEVSWGLVVKIDQAEAHAPLAQILRAISFAAFATIAFIIAGWLYVLHPIAHRLRRTAAAAHRITDGNLSSRIDDDGYDEIGDVARSIDRLAAELDTDRRMRGAVEYQLRHHALHDELTGLYNRKHANAVILEHSEPADRRTAIAFLDLDGFKNVNDLYGHSAGDAVLVAIAGRLERVVDDEATLARWGGDEFVIILPNGDARAAEAVAARVRRVFDEPVVTEFATHQLGCSIGLSVADAERTLADAVVDADARMYEQKKRRKRDRHIETVTARNVEKALRDNRIEIWFQPIVSVSGPGKVRLQSVEALVRMRTLKGMIVGPNEFLQDIRKRELGRELDRRVMTRSLEALARWRRARIVDAEFRLAINLTGESLRAVGFVDDVAEQLSRLDVPADRLIVELSEQTGGIDHQVLSRLRTLGVGLALDDVGLHRSNLDRLVGLAPDIAKIDRLWVDDDVVMPRLVDICHQLDMQIVAEGVETREQLDRITALGVTRFQGYLFGRAMPGVQFVAAWGARGRSGLPDSTAAEYPACVV